MNIVSVCSYAVYTAVEELAKALPERVLVEPDFAVGNMYVEATFTCDGDRRGTDSKILLTDDELEQMRLAIASLVDKAKRDGLKHIFDMNKVGPLDKMTYMACTDRERMASARCWLDPRGDGKFRFVVQVMGRP